MNQKPKHTDPPPNSLAATYGYRYVGILVSQGVAWRHTVSKQRHEPYSSLKIKPLGADSLNSFKNKQDMRQTDYTYFGARYYDSDISVWLSVDTRPHISPYSYTQLNPINRIDPDGNLDDWGQGNGEIYWDSKATSKETTKAGEEYLGKSGASYDKKRDLMVHYKSDGTKTERKSTELSGVEITGQRKSPTAKKSKNIKNKSAPYTSWSGVVGQVARYENTLFKNPGAPTKFIAKNGTRLGWVGEAISISIASYNVYQNPTWGNYGRLGVSVGIASTNAIPYAGPGIYFGLTVLESGGGFNPFYDYLDNCEKLYKETGLIIVPSTRGPLIFHFKNIK